VHLESIGCRSGSRSCVAIHTIARLAVLGLSGGGNVTTMHGGTSHTGLVAVSEAVTSDGNSTGGHLSVASWVGLAVASPERSATPLGVVVGGRWAETLLLLVVTSQHELEACGDKEEEDGANGNSEAGGV